MQTRQGSARVAGHSDGEREPKSCQSGKNNGLVCVLPAGPAAEAMVPHTPEVCLYRREATWDAKAASPGSSPDCICSRASGHLREGRNHRCPLLTLPGLASFFFTSQLWLKTALSIPGRILHYVQTTWTFPCSPHGITVQQPVLLNQRH